MDAYIISKVISYFPLSYIYNLGKEIKNKDLTKNLLEKCYRKTSYVVYPLEKGLKILSIPTKKEKSDFPEMNYDEMTGKSIPNYMFFYSSKDKVIHAFTLLP